MITGSVRKRKIGQTKRYWVTENRIFAVEKMVGRTSETRIEVCIVMEAIIQGKRTAG